MPSIHRDMPTTDFKYPSLDFALPDCSTSFNSFPSERDTAPGHWHRKCKGAGLKGMHRTGLCVHQPCGQCKYNHITLWKNNKPKKFGLESKRCEQSTAE